MNVEGDVISRWGRILHFLNVAYIE
jgi:hypothetical protein